MPEYFAAYEDEFDLRVRRPVRIDAVRSVGAELAVETSVGTWTTRALINATGTWTHPFVPRWPGQESFRGRQLHTADYRGPAEFAGKRVVVVGGGTSAVQLLLEIAPVAAATTWVTRRPPVWHDGPFDAEAGPGGRRAGRRAGPGRPAAAQRGERDRADADAGGARRGSRRACCNATRYPSASPRPA